jgi:hypothetical protein
MWYAALMPVPAVDMHDDGRPVDCDDSDGVFLRRGLTSRHPTLDQVALNATASQCGTRIHAGV